MSDKLKLEVLFAAIEKVTAPLKAIRNDSKQTSAEIKALQNHLRNLKTEQSRLLSYNMAGTAPFKKLGADIDVANQKLREHKLALERVNEQMGKINAARAKYDSSMRMRDKALNAGVSMGAVGAVTGAPIIGMISQYASFEDAMLGVAKQVDGARDKNGKLTKTYYEIADSIKAMSERLPMAANDIAQIVEAGARMGIKGKRDLMSYAETAIKMADAMQLPVEVAGENIAKTANLFKIPIANIKQLGDTINYLDDNALSKGGDIIEVLNRIAGTAGTVKMAYKDAAALASTFLSSGATAEIAATASNAIMNILGTANMQSKSFQQGLSMLKMSSNDIQNSMSKNSTGTILRVLDAINKLPDNKKLEATTRLFGKEYGDDVSKLAGNIQEYRRQLMLVQSASGNGSMDKEAAARLQNLNAQYQIDKNTLQNLSTELGQNFKPALIEIMGTVSSVLKGIRDWTKQHPQLTNFILKTVAGIAIFSAALSAVLIGIASVIAPIAIFKLSLAMLSFTFAGFIPAVAAAAVAFAPFIIAGAAVGAFAAVIYNNWGRIKSFFADIWSGVANSTINAFNAIKQFQWSDLGRWIISGIEAGLDSLTFGLYSKTKNIAKGMYGAAKEQLGIKSPSRVFAELGNYTMLGLGKGLGDGEGDVLNRVRATAKAMAGIGAGMVLGTSAFANQVQFDTRAPIGKSGGGGYTPAPITIHIHTTPGQNAQDIAQQVAQAIQQHEQRKATRARSSMRDTE